MNGVSSYEPTEGPIDQSRTTCVHTQPTVGSCCAKFAEPAWHRTMSPLGGPRKCREEVVELVYRAVACPARCLDQVRDRANRCRAPDGVDVFSLRLMTPRSFA